MIRLPGSRPSLKQRLSRLPWFVLLWLALAGYVALHSVAVLETRLACAAPAGMATAAAALVRWMQYLLPGIGLVATLRAFRRRRRRDW